MTTKAPDTSATEEANVDNTNADLTGLPGGEEGIDGPNDQRLNAPAGPDQDTTEQMDDAAFTEFMNAQLGDVPHVETSVETETVADGQEASLPATDKTDASDAENLPEVEAEAVTDGQAYTFKIDGQDITVSDPADINRLLERGLNSAAEAKLALPAQKLAQMLSNNKITTDAQLNHLLDIANGDKGALRQLLKDKGIDSYDLASPEGEAKAEDEYKPTDHTVTDNTIALNRVLDSLQDSESFATTADVVMEQWDPVSRQVFMDNPNNFKVLNAQVADGTYEVINTEIKKLGIMGKLPAGESQFQIYQLVGNTMYANKQLPGQTPEAVAETNLQPETVPAQLTPEQRLQQAANVQKRKRAVAPNRSVPNHTTQQVAAPSDVYASSDDDFIKATQHLFNSM